MNIRHTLLSGEINVVDHAKSCHNIPSPSFKFEGLLIGYKSKFKDRLLISILASISQPYLEQFSSYRVD